MTVLRTGRRRFVGANIKGNPKMRRRKVAEDLRVIRDRADAYGLQEFRWADYWLALAVNLSPVSADGWRSYPNVAKGAAAPVRAAQGIGWKAKYWRCVGRRVALLHDGIARVSETRFLRAALLADRKHASLRAWHGSTHNVVGGDEAGDGPLRKAMLADNLTCLAKFLDELLATGDAVIFQLDANIHEGTAAYERLLHIVHSRGGSFHGELGIEFLFTIDGDRTRVVVEHDFVIRPGVLNTDHEARGIVYRLVAR